MELNWDYLRDLDDRRFIVESKDNEEEEEEYEDDIVD